VLAGALLLGWAAQAEPLPPGAATTGKAKRAVGTGVLNLNAATLEQLDALPGISPKAAAAVVARRTTRPFARPEEVLEVKGVGRRRFERLRPHLAVSGPTTFQPATRSRPPPRARTGASARPTPRG
jgi:competence protein ComEA